MRPFSFLLSLAAVLAAGVLLGMAARELLAGRGSPTNASPAAPSGVALAPDVEPRVTPASERGEAVVELTETELEHQLNTRVAGRPIGSTPLGDATAESFAVSLRRGQIEIGGWSRIGPARVPFAVVGTVTPSAGGRPTVQVTDARLGDVPMPESTRGQIQRGLQNELDAQLERHPVQVRSIEIGGGRMRIIGAPGA